MLLTWRLPKVWLDGSSIDNLQSQAVVRAGQATFNFESYLQQNNFNQQRLWADGNTNITTSPSRNR